MCVKHCLRSVLEPLYPHTYLDNCAWHKVSSSNNVDHLQPVPSSMAGTAYRHALCAGMRVHETHSTLIVVRWKFFSGSFMSKSKPPLGWLQTRFRRTLPRLVGSRFSPSALTWGMRQANAACTPRRSCFASIELGSFLRCIISRCPSPHCSFAHPSVHE
jgi:hypothetical protein